MVHAIGVLNNGQTDRIFRKSDIGLVGYLAKAISMTTFSVFWGFGLFILNYNPRREWAGPGGTAIPGQPVAKAEQAPDTSPSSKNQFNIDVPWWGTYQILS